MAGLAGAAIVGGGLYAGSQITGDVLRYKSAQAQIAAQQQIYGNMFKTQLQENQSDNYTTIFGDQL